MGECSGAKGAFSYLLDASARPAPAPPGNIPLRPAPFSERQWIQDSGCSLVVSIPYLQPPCHFSLLFYLVSKKKVSSSKVSPSVALNSTPPFVFSRTLHSWLSFLCCTVYSQPQDLYHPFKYFTVSFQKSLLHPVTSSFVYLLFTVKLSKRPVSTSYHFSEGSNLDPAPTISPNGS